MITVESALECDACYHFEFEKDIVRFCSQPIRFPYYLNGKQHTYVPDFLVQFDSQEYVLYEIKSSDAVSSTDFRAEWDAKMQAADQLGLELELVKEKDIRKKAVLKNLKLMYRYASVDGLTDNQKLVLSIFEKVGTQSVKTLLHTTSLAPKTIMPVLCNLLSRNLLETELDVTLSIESKFELAYHAKKII
ncbi:TnsA endonuclease N-terminal domain-containing protein [Photobacterium sanguinicancri]|uniref:TnsA endonuclease N-terminal domain-containing protein n=1 Tax=Photobacterium sanguinicancri TaxID=875932 RepID=UPI0024813D19|nr:TnsA endonuclease N-terminal domain-containing protein [Photobacterium sanguinicancri]